MKKILSSMGLCLSLSLTSAAFAQQTAEEVTNQYLRTLNQSGLSGTTAWFHPDELRKFKSAFMSLFEQRDNPEFIAGFFGKKMTFEELEAMSDEQFTQQVFGTISKMLKAEDIKFNQSTILGSVKEGELNHMLVRQHARVEKIDFSSVQIVTLKPYQGEWKLMFSDKLDTMIRAMQARMAAKQ